MKHIASLFLLGLLTVNTANAQFASAPAFPGAEGYGRFTTGGRGGDVYHVTSLEDDAENPTEGMLRYYISKKSGARTIVFDVAGNIELKAPLKISKGDLSILGQTAPGEGICIKGYNLSINASNVVIRFIRCRLGNYGGDDDAMSAAHHDDAIQKNIIIDHCSMSWCTDEVGSFYGNKDFTLQWCILSESLKTNSFKEGTHGFGGIWGGQKASFHHNLLAHNDSRMIRFDHGYVSELIGPVDYVNNVVYNWGSNSTYGGENNAGKQSKQFNMIANYYKPGPGTANSAATRLLNPTTNCGNCTSPDVPGKFYIKDNYMYGSASVTNDNTCSSAIKMDNNSPISYEDWKASYVSSSRFTTSDAAFQYNTISQQKAEKAFDLVLKYAGASLSRDDVDTRVANDVKNGTGDIIDYTSPLIEWKNLTGNKVVDTDGDGMPDDFELKYGLDPQRANANDYDLDEKKYYTNLEVYANSLVEDIVKAERELADATFEEYYPEFGKQTSQTYHFSSTFANSNTLEYLDGAKISLTGNTAKTYGAGSELIYKDSKFKGIKLSNGAQNTFYAPEGKGISNVKIICYKHGSGTRSTFWYEGDGTEYGTAELIDEKMVFTPNNNTPLITEVAVEKLCSTPNIQEFNIGGKPSFTFTNGGEQLAFILDVTYGELTGINGIITSGTNKQQKARKFFQNGRLVIETANGIFTITGSRVK